jgi:hypothetical protein
VWVFRFVAVSSAASSVERAGVNVRGPQWNRHEEADDTAGSADGPYVRPCGVASYVGSGELVEAWDDYRSCWVGLD